MATARAPRPLWLRTPVLVTALAVVAAWHGAGGSLAALGGSAARRAVAELAAGFWPPAHAPEFLAGLARPLLETVAIAVLGLGLAFLAAAPLAYWAVSPEVHAACGRRPTAARRAAFVAARGVLAVLRAVPEVVWALLFVRAVGIGPLPGVLALAVSYTGVLGKVYAEIVESVPRRPAEALSAAGARPSSALVLGLGPAARPVLTSYTLYRFDCALRTSAVLGLVGAGGAGQQIELALKMLAYDEVAAWVLALFLLVGAVDVVSTWVRRRLRTAPSVFPRTRAEAVRWTALGVAAAAVALASARVLDLSPSVLLSGGALRGMADFAARLWPPLLDPALLRSILPAAGETLAVAVLGTALAAAAGFALGSLAAPRLAEVGAAGGAGSGASRARRAVAVVARAFLALGRTLPELLWALLFTFVVGLGPFAGALALAVHTGGVLGRLYADALEEVPEGPVRALRAGGATPAAAAALGVLPQALPQLTAYTLYRFEVNVRAAAVLGVVGAGGLGRELFVALSLFQYGRAATLVLALLVLVLAVDAGSEWVRDRLTGRARPVTAASADAEAVLPA
jgi:phosphonate transport system permease protein